MRRLGICILLCGLLFLPSYARAKVSAEQGNDIVHVGRPVNVGPDETVGDAVCIGCPIHLAGRASGDLVAVGGSVQVEGTVQGDAVVVGGNLRLGPGADVHGDVSIVGGTLQRDATARIGGEISNPRLLVGKGGLLILLLAPFLFLLFLGVVISVLCAAVAGERRIETIVTALRQHTGLGLLAGLAVVVGFFVLIGVFHWAGPLAPVVSFSLFLAVLLLAIVGYTGVSAWVGHGLAPAAGLMGAVIAGAVLVGVLQAVPVVGLFAVVIFGLLALGGAALSGLGTDPNWLSRRLFNPPPHPPARAASGH